MLALVLENQPDSPFANLRRITCRMSSHSSSSFSQDGTSGKAGAVQRFNDDMSAFDTIAARSYGGSHNRQ